MSLKATIETLAEKFATDIMRALRTASINEVAGVSAAAPAKTNGATKTTPKKRGRRSNTDVTQVVDALVAAVTKAAEKGMRAPDLQKALKLEQKDLTKPIAEALSKKLLKKKGQRRGTTYFAA